MYTQADLDQVRRAIVDVNQRVQYGDRSVTKEDLDTLLRKERRIMDHLGLVASGRGTRRLASFRKGIVW